MVKATPSLVICLLFDCNLNCIYCPPNGENLQRFETLCDVDTIIELLRIAKENGIEMVRITGGEPLLQKNRLKKILDFAIPLNFKRLVLNTNGTQLKKNLYWLHKYKDRFECKVSLDTLDAKEYHKITTKNSFQTVIGGIVEAKSMGMKIVINTVVNKVNKGSIKNILSFCEENGLDMKLFDMSNFGDTFKKRWLKYYTPVKDIIQYLEKNYIKEIDERLSGGRGRLMTKFITQKMTKIIVIDHHSNGNALFSCQCQSCRNYPCVSGRLCITLRADGFLSPCRINIKFGKMINKLEKIRLEKIFLSQLKVFENCHYS